jgi:hypothetical protein
MVNTTGTSERQKQWREELNEGEGERQMPAPATSRNSSIPMDNDDTLGIP